MFLFLSSDSIFYLLTPPAGYFLPPVVTPSYSCLHKRVVDEMTDTLKNHISSSTFAVLSGSSRNKDYVGISCFCTFA